MVDAAVTGIGGVGIGFRVWHPRNPTPTRNHTRCDFSVDLAAPGLLGSHCFVRGPVDDSPRAGGQEAATVIISRRQTRMVTAVLIVGLLFVAGSVGRAVADDTTRKRKDISLMVRKFSRGVMNVLTCWVEVPKNMALRWKETDPFTGIIYGHVEGVIWMAARLIGGVYEVVSFPFPYPDDYAPLIEPEFILSPLWGEAPPIMTEKSVNPAKSFE